MFLNDPKASQGGRGTLSSTSQLCTNSSGRPVEPTHPWVGRCRLHRLVDAQCLCGLFLLGWDDHALAACQH